MVVETSAPPRSAPRTPWSVRLLGLGAVVLTAVLVPPYLVPGASTLVSRESDLLRVLLVVHVVVAGAALIVGTLQLVPRIRWQRAVHRRIGRAFLVLGTVGFVVTGLPLALTAGSTFQRVGLLIPTLLWPVLAVAGFLAIRRRDVAAHRSWMLRLYAVSWFAVSARLIVPLLMVVMVPLSGGDVESAVEEAVPVGQWLGWIVDLAVAEWVIRRRPRLA